MKTKIIVILLCLSSSITGLALPPEDGKAIFSSRCASCHNVNKILTGPALGGVDKRHSTDWIIKFVRSSQTLIKSGDKEAAALFEKFNHVTMPDHPDLTDDNIKSIIDYIKTASQEKAAAAPFAKPSRLRPDYLPVSIRNITFFAGYLVLVGLLVVALVFAVHVKGLQRKTEENL